MKKSTYINGLDEILHGGFIKPSAILVAGTAGSGKTTLCLQSLFNAAKNGESCLFLSMLSESPAMIMRSLSQYSFYDKSVIESGKLRIICVDSGVIEKGDYAIFEFINNNILKYRPSCVVIDPITILEYIVKTFEEKKLEYPEKRGFALTLFSEFEAWDALLLMTGELSGEEIANNPWTYMVDSVIMLDKRAVGKERQRYLEVVKMRGSDYFMGEHTYTITGDGITVFPRFVPHIITAEMPSGSISTGIKVLVADDTPEVIELLKHTLKYENWEVVEAKNGKEALGMVFAEGPDIILLDIIMPEMNGYQVVEILRSHRTTKDIPIIMLTAKGGKEEKLKGMEIGIDDYITKPFLPEELVARIKMVMRRSVK